MDENQVLNPFGFGEVSRVIDENRKPFEHWWWYVNLNAVFVENEFYILFSDGLLVKKGRSKFKNFPIHKWRKIYFICSKL
jgi:hypothetical protein